MAKLIILVFSLIGLISVCVAQVVQEGQCDPDLELQPNFNLENFLGTWNEYYRIENPNQQGDCSAFTFTNTDNDLNVYYSSVNNNFLEESEGPVSQDGDTAKLKLSIPLFENPIDFWVQQTIYDSFAITFSCENISDSHRRLYIWVLARNSGVLMGMTLAFVRTTILIDFGIELETFRSIDHSDDTCNVLPVIEPGNPIIFPGLCNPNLEVVQGFDIDRFSGIWHQISSYETSNARGTCVRAEYTKSDGVINILNSQVVDQEIETIDGHASVSSTDESAKLTVVLNIPGGSPTSQDMWILRSDYDNYAVAYTCVNDEINDQRRVYSWILSRERQNISPSVQTAIDEAIRSYFDLNSVYYQATDQSDAGCFFYPEPTDRPVVFRGQCQSVNVHPMPDFEAEKYMGIWHNIEMYPSSFQDGTCSNAFYELIDGSDVAVVNSQVKDQRLETITALAVPASDGSAKLTVTFPGQTVSADYWILDTDYSNYAFVYTCQNLNTDEMQVGSWKLSTTKKLLPESEQAIDEIISKVKYLDKMYYKVVDQTEVGCFYFPEPQENVPVVFPGQCEENIGVVENFNFAAFDGIWFEIESYPKAERTGQCFDHQFTFVDNTRLDLVSYSVSDQFRAELNGVVTRSSASENNGKLTITITDASGQVKTIPFWVLAVNYGDFALAYACEDIGVDFRAVWSWKLSRTRELTPAANTAISNAMAENIVLHDNYFQKIDHSNDACFYLPELEPGEPVILLGQCDPNIRGISDFNIEKYAGRWRLIESYGSDYQDGTCNVARYTQQDSNTLSVTNSQVVDGELASITGTATVSSSDGSGQLTFNFPSRDENFDVIILDTDYDSYALAYGCVDLPDNQMRVYSWKMSRENTLSPDANSKINEIIDGIRVLHNRFYYSIDRSDTGCFYLPTPDPSSIVKFRGQCDQNIPVVPNFQLDRYLGRWFDIESYPEYFQDGRCNTATYSEHHQPGIDMDVYNTQVINQGLFSIRGTAVQEPSEDGSAKFTVTFNVAGTDVSAKYWVLATDYESYALVYSCRPVDDEYVQVTSWKLSRTKELTLFAKAEIDRVMNDIRVLDQNYFIERDHSPEGCFYFPEPQPGVPVVFPGQCDKTIAAEPNFNMNYFQGTWHEITAYPKADQVGECISQQFTVTGSSTMRLDSFSVLDLTQYTTESHVTFASDDLSGKLNINTLVNGEAISRPFWILSTDYTDYALVYSCVNLDDYYRSVWSWKLSRSRQLSDIGDAAINDAIARVDVLTNDYYENVQQSDAACFHLPDITPGDDVVLPGRCDPNIKGVPDFDITKYSGEWRLIESYGSGYQSGTCNVAQYTQQASNILGVTNSQVVDGELASISGTATVSSSDGSGQLTFHLNNEEYEVYILDTDYDTYALAYGCENLENDQRRVTSWKFSRSNTLSQDATNKINDVINSIEVLHQPYYYTVDRSPYACFYFPKPDRNTPVRFRGQCDESIPAVPDFKLEDYMGLWHDIESYPVAFQDGECPNAQYTLLSSNTASVFNTHVVDQTLRAIDGVATVASTDGSAKLKVTFDGLNINDASDYWVLATDYTSYAFVYSCRNLDDDYMSVASWKLSKTRALTAPALAEIDRVMNDIRALDQRYFIQRDQTPEGCFYFPEPQPGVPVVFPGQCDATIAAEPNFNMNDFQGTWHEITAYPKADQDGECISQQFTVTGSSTMRLDSFSVLDLTQYTTESHVTFASDDFSGKLNIITLVNGEAISRPYWILSTDYTDYALVYSCVNLNDYYRTVWSWKLSRSRHLSDIGDAAINDAIARVDVLKNDYYENVQQTDAACFHLPDITPGDNVVLPGRCDPNIRGVPDFDITKYAGEWRLIESYGSGYQSGTCNVAQYTQQASNILGVTNSQVVDGELASISGTATVSSSDGSGQLTFHLNNEEYQVYVLDTDYDTYALAYGCENLVNDQRRVTSWKFSRSNTLSQDATNKINDVINSIEVLHQPYYYTVDRSPYACFYFPKPDRNTPVRFRGQCDESIPAVPDFKLEDYMGLWHDIESYPVAFQDGECPNAKYTLLSSNTASVSNSHVVDQTLGVIDGVATVASTDGSAKLKVTFDGQNSNDASDYWVLATDYTSYAFVYSCRNLDDDYMSVASWKLSKTRALTAPALAEIDRVMNDIRALDQRYFIQRDQTPEGCFYFPEPQPGVPVVFPGQCDATIAAEPNFNMNDFQGTWHEITAYPKADQDGECISQQFTVTGSSTMRLDSFSVLDLTQYTTESHVTFASDDLSGKLNINTLVNGEAISRPYWILSTDYTDYALVYSCVNLNDYYRTVWSWKLSRSRQLSDIGDAAINDAIARVDVLKNDYYENVQQTDAACFHLPDITPGDNVVLPGRCDPNIRGVPDFDITKYAGEWRLIESYGSGYQSGTCNVAQYTQQDSNILGVTNSQVVDGELASISGTATVSSSDGSGQLTFHLNNEEYQVYILDTDYDTYALAYGCENLVNDQRRVTSWKFSRSNTLSQDATNKINDVINSIEVLHQPYYYTVDRSPYACFYFPKPDRNTPVRFRGQCDESIPAVPDFKLEDYMGLWHDIESYPVAFQDGECPNAKYTLLSSNTASVSNSHVVDQTLGVIDGVATVASTDGSAKLKVTFDGQNSNDASDYWVLATDYTSYAFVYSCRNLDDDYMSVASWKLSKTRALTAPATAEIDRVMNAIRALDQRYFIQRDQTPEGCFYFPEPQPGVPVVFPGQCDETIAAEPNFNMNDFQGTWHEITAYPKADQDGECISQQFTVTGSSTMRLDSFSVLDLTQYTTESHVTFASDDLSGKLNINTLVNGEAISRPYWILSTDYTDYALVYSCVNLNDYYRSVWSWKLSKSRQLSNEGNAAINDAIARVDVLRNDYYENVQQTDAACFFYPVLGPSDPVIFPGRCDPSIPVLQNFDAPRYLGRWRFIESYYSDFQEGTCNAATYSSADDDSSTVIVVNSQVVDEQLNSITGSAVSIDGSGKLIVTFPNAAPIDYWILDTDYDSYALIYTCVDLPNDQRRVWSWKMSRSSSLTLSASNAINQIVDSINVLDAQYYQPIDRTEVGCFYYPVPDHTSNVIFPGQCDESIPVLESFNAQLYAGIWYDVESYPTNFQSGTCNTANYTANSDGSLTVKNTQVVNQLLETITGTAVPSSTDGSAKFDVTLTSSPGIDVTRKYWVLATDYETYSIVYSCRNIDDEFREVYSWKLGKELTLPEAALNTINAIIEDVQVLDQDYFVERSHTAEDCFYYPDQNDVEIIMDGQCLPDAEVPAVNNFNANAFAGLWHEVSRYPSAFQSGECTATEYSLDGANVFDVTLTSVIDEEKLTTVTQAGVATGGRGVISINVDGVPFDNVYVLAINPTEYALLYSCRDLDSNRKQLYSWKLSRTRAGLSEAANNVIDGLVTSNIDLHEPYYRRTRQDHAACFYYPVFDHVPFSIELPGPCDESISGVPNFNVNAFLGTWHEVARYPNEAQTGQCISAQYVPGDTAGTGSVVISEIINDALATISGEAVTSNDGQIEVTFNVGDDTRTAKYYVLSTDYTSHALLYSCTTIDNGDRRRVGSWKLSRTTELSQQADAAINEVIRTTEGLLDDYYQDTSHTDAACFYYPVFDQLPPYIELPGPCNTSITGVPNFDIERYLGTWNEVARYPQQAQTGQCTINEYESGATSGAYSVMISQIFNEALSKIRGEATVTSIDGTGKLEVRFSVNYVPSHFNYYVLATDYTGYALVYTCFDSEDGRRRQVGSWKLSRNTDLSENANTVINEVISETQGLNNNYYQATSHSHAACFHYPAQTGDRVILPGQCDTTIAAVESFNVARFANNSWYQIRRYDAVGGSSCVGTRLTYDIETRNINVVSFEVVNEDLLTTEGTGRLNSDDGSGIFSLVMDDDSEDGEPEETTIYILATDYDGYALAYSCRNINSDQRQVGAWQLSRGRTMTEAGNTAIAEMIERRQELYESYFRPISHEGECLEPSSAFSLKSSIIVIFVCTVIQVIR